MRYIGSYNGAEIEVDFIADTELTDYGVPRSPVWREIIPETVKIQSLSILGCEVKEPYSLPSGVIESIEDLADEVEFQPEEGASL